MEVTAIIAGAGSGTRLGAHKPKALVELLGEPLICWAVRGMRAGGVTQIVVTVPADDPTAAIEFGEALQSAGLADVVLTSGGGTRQESVARGLAAVHDHFPGTTHVLIHDAARALTPPAMIRRVTGALAVGMPAVIPVLPVTDTIKIITPDQDAAQAAAYMRAKPVPAYTEAVVRTAARETLRAVQTPQGFELELIRRAHAAGVQLSANEQQAAPDDAALVELLGEPVRTVPGDARALKITTPFDLQVAQLLAADMP